MIETSSINRIHLSRPEDRRRAIFRNVDFIFFIFCIFIFYILFTIKTMDKVLVTSGSQYHISLSKPFRIQLKKHHFPYFINTSFLKLLIWFHFHYLLTQTLPALNCFTSSWQIGTAISKVTGSRLDDLRPTFWHRQKFSLHHVWTSSECPNRIFLDVLTLEDKTTRLSPNTGHQLPTQWQHHIPEEGRP